MNILDHYLDAFRNYANFKGRVNRPQYWYFILINAIIGIIIGFIQSDTLMFIYQIAIIIPSLAIGARRLHDINKSGWWQLIALIPIIGSIWLIVLFATKGDEGDNQYGSPVSAENIVAKDDEEPTEEEKGGVDTRETEFVGKLEELDETLDRVDQLGEEIEDHLSKKE